MHYITFGRWKLATEAFEEIIQDFEFLETWEDRYGYIIDLGKSMPGLEEKFKTPATKVEGCASQVWFDMDFVPSDSGLVFYFKGDSDAIIVRGLIAILTRLFNGLTIEQVSQTDAHSELQKLDLRNHLSLQRSNGLVSMIAKIKNVSAKVLESKLHVPINSHESTH